MGNIPSSPSLSPSPSSSTHSNQQQQPTVPFDHSIFRGPVPIIIGINRSFDAQNATYLARYLSHPKCPSTDLYLHSAVFQPRESLYHIFTAGLMKNTSLHTLDLSNLQLDDHATPYLLNLLTTHPALQVLILNQNNFSNRSAHAILQILPKNITLHTIQMDFNPLLVHPRLIHKLTQIHTRPALVYGTTDLDHVITVHTPAIVQSNSPQYTNIMTESTTQQQQQQQSPPSPAQLPVSLLSTNNNPGEYQDNMINTRQLSFQTPQPTVHTHAVTYAGQILNSSSLLRASATVVHPVTDHRIGTAVHHHDTTVSTLIDKPEGAPFPTTTAPPPLTPTLNLERTFSHEDAKETLHYLESSHPIDHDISPAVIIPTISPHQDEATQGQGQQSTAAAAAAVGNKHLNPVTTTITSSSLQNSASSPMLRVIHPTIAENDQVNKIAITPRNDDIKHKSDDTNNTSSMIDRRHDQRRLSRSRQISPSPSSHPNFGHAETELEDSDDDDDDDDSWATSNQLRRELTTPFYVLKPDWATPPAAAQATLPHPKSHDFASITTSQPTIDGYSGGIVDYFAQQQEQQQQREQGGEQQQQQQNATEMTNNTPSQPSYPTNNMMHFVTLDLDYFGSVPETAAAANSTFPSGRTVVPGTTTTDTTTATTSYLTTISDRSNFVRNDSSLSKMTTSADFDHSSQFQPVTTIGPASIVPGSHILLSQVKETPLGQPTPENVLRTPRTMSISQHETQQKLTSAIPTTNTITTTTNTTTSTKSNGRKKRISSVISVADSEHDSLLPSKSFKGMLYANDGADIGSKLEQIVEPSDDVTSASSKLQKKKHRPTISEAEQSQPSSTSHDLSSQKSTTDLKVRSKRSKSMSGVNPPVSTETDIAAAAAVAKASSTLTNLIVQCFAFNRLEEEFSMASSASNNPSSTPSVISSSDLSRNEHTITSGSQTGPFSFENPPKLPLDTTPEDFESFASFGNMCKLYRRDCISLDRYIQALLYFFTFPQLCLVVPRLILSLYDSELAISDHPNASLRRVNIASGEKQIQASEFLSQHVFRGSLAVTAMTNVLERVEQYPQLQQQQQQPSQHTTQHHLTKTDVATGGNTDSPDDFASTCKQAQQLQRSVTKLWRRLYQASLIYCAMAQVVNARDEEAYAAAYELISSGGEAAANQITLWDSGASYDLYNWWFDYGQSQLDDMQVKVSTQQQQLINAQEQYQQRQQKQQKQEEQGNKSQFSNDNKEIETTGKQTKPDLHISLTIPPTHQHASSSSVQKPSQFHASTAKQLPPLTPSAMRARLARYPSLRRGGAVASAGMATNTASAAPVSSSGNVASTIAAMENELQRSRRERMIPAAASVQQQQSSISTHASSTTSPGTTPQAADSNRIKRMSSIEPNIIIDNNNVTDMGCLSVDDWILLARQPDVSQVTKFLTQHSDNLSNTHTTNTPNNLHPQTLALFCEKMRAATTQHGKNHDNSSNTLNIQYGICGNPLRKEPRLSTLLFYVHLVFPNPSSPDGRYSFIDSLPQAPELRHVKLAYRKLSFVVHPDRLANKDHEIQQTASHVFSTISAAYRRFEARNQ